MQLSHCYEITVGRFIRKNFYVYEVANTVVKRVCRGIAGTYADMSAISYSTKKNLYLVLERIIKSRLMSD